MRDFLDDYNTAFHYEDYALINVNLPWSLYNYSQNENQKDKPDRFLKKIRKISCFCIQLQSYYCQTRVNQVIPIRIQTIGV